jgi:predicted GNAT family N-acyltransferase
MTRAAGRSQREAPQQPLRTPFRVRHATWAADAPALMHVRRTVFVVEQAIPEDMEWDAADPVAQHALAEDATGAAIGCARLLADAHIGRVAVLAPWRHLGVGSALLACLVEAARDRGERLVRLNAQVQALPFYARHGFRVEGAPFDEAGIAHQAMVRVLG